MRFALVALVIVIFGACGGDTAGTFDAPVDTTPDTAVDAMADATADASAEASIEIEVEADLGEEAADDVDTTPAGPVDFVVELIESAGPAGDRTGFAIAGRLYMESTAGGTTVGDCTFYPAAVFPFCDPTCAPGTICAADGECAAPLEPLSAGDITVAGLEVGLSLHPETQYFYYTPTYTPEPTDGDLFAEDATLLATASGGNVPAFQIAVSGVEDLATDLACPPPLTPGQALAANWQAGSGNNVHLDLESGNHGGQFARIACDTADDGALVVDATLIEAYLAAPRPLDLWRLTRSNATSQGRVRLSATSQVSCRW